MPIVVLRVDQVEEMVDKSVAKHFSLFLKNSQKTTEVQETLNINEALKLLQSLGAPFVKSTIYKHTHEGTIPHKRIGKRLIFSRTELIDWFESQITEKETKPNETLILAASARRKK